MLKKKSIDFRNKNFVGIQIGLVSFLDEGVPEVLDILQDKAHVNALIPSTVSWSRGNAGRATDWYPDHGIAEPDNLEGGGMIDADPKYYKNTFLDDFHARDELYQGVDFLDLITEEAQKRDMAIYPYYCETSRIEPRHLNIPGWVHVLEVDAYGRRTGRPCVNNPEYIGWWRSVIENHFKEYEIDGFLWGIERKGPLFLTLDGQETTCFCKYCQERAKNDGIDVKAARLGYQRLDKFMKRVRAGYKPADGVMVELLRILLHNPEIVHYEKMWHESHKDLARELYGLMKWLQPDAFIGQMVWQYINTFNPILRAQWDLSEFKEFADWVKPVMYHIPAGPRMRGIVEGYTSSWLGDFNNDEATRMLYKILQLDEPDFDKLINTGFSAEYVKNETARTVLAMGPEVEVYPGIGVGVQGIGELEITPEDAKEAVRAAYRGGATGITISRNYSELMLENLAAVGDALDELGIGETIPEGISEVKVERKAVEQGEDKDIFAS